MSTKPTQKKMPFIVEPLDWTAPANHNDPVQAHQDDAEQKASVSEEKTDR